MTVIVVSAAGGPGFGKSTVIKAVKKKLEEMGVRCRVVEEWSRTPEGQRFGHPKSSFECFFSLEMQKGEELKSLDGNNGEGLTIVLTDTPLVSFFICAQMHWEDERDDLAVELLRQKCTELKNRYELFFIPKDLEMPYQNDPVRVITEERAKKKHRLYLEFLEKICPDKLLYVTGSPNKRADQVINWLDSRGYLNLSKV